jgi:hypothetical protein
MIHQFLQSLDRARVTRQKRNRERTTVYGKLGTAQALPGPGVLKKPPPLAVELIDVTTPRPWAYPQGRPWGLPIARRGSRMMTMSQMISS